MRQNSVEADIAAWKYVNVLENFFTIIFFIIIIIRHFLWKQNLFQKWVGHMTWKLLRKKQNLHINIKLKQRKH